MLNKDCTSAIAVLSALILVFSFWQIEASKWVIIVAAALILIKSVFHLAKPNGCSDGRLFKKKSKEEVSITGDPTAKMPSKKEVKKTMSKTVPKNKQAKVKAA